MNFHPSMMGDLAPGELVEMMVGAGIELGLRMYDERTGRTDRMFDGCRTQDELGSHWTCDVEPTWPMYPPGHSDRDFVEKAKAARDADGGFRAWLEGALWTRVSEEAV